MARRVAVVAHTHWDREWQRPAEAGAHRFAGLIERHLERCRADPSAMLLLDGQMAVIDDHLAAHPADRAALAALVAAGRLEIGPWYTLPDEFLVSGETLVRNLQAGIAAAAPLGGATAVGYLPDSFGHCAQMPQLLRLAGITHAVVWRGVPDAVDRCAFWWRAPDGSTVRAEHLPVGYGIGAHLPSSPTGLARRLHALEAELADLLGDDDPLLVLHGGDGLEPHPDLAALLTATAAADPTLAPEATTLSAYLASAPTAALPDWHGELRGNARANLLPGVTSTRADVRRAAAAAEDALEALAEPLAALWLDADRWPAPSLGGAWRAVLHNAAHDSVCACSTDDVVTAVRTRYRSATAVAGEVVADALAAAAAQLPTGTSVCNPSAHPRSGLVEVVTPGPLPPGGQELDRQAPAVERRRGTGADLGRLLGELAADGWLPGGTPSGPWPGRTARAVLDAATGDGGCRLRLVVDPATTASVDPDVASVVAEAWAQAGAHRGAPLEVVVERRPGCRALLRAVDVPGWGWAPAGSAAGAPAPPVRAGATWVDNGLLHVAVDPADGTWSLDGLDGLGALVDGGDAGDTYTWCPPVHDTVVGAPDRVLVEKVEAGPLRAALTVRTHCTWPEAVEGGRRVGAVTSEIVTRLEVRAGEPFVRVVVEADNRARDHRLRLLLPLEEPADATEAGTAFASVRRTATGRPGRTEAAITSHPARGWVRAGGLTVAVGHVVDTELLDDGAVLALTVLRAVGVLSRPSLATRPNQAGPALPLRDAQVPGPQQLRLIVARGRPDPWRLADELRAPLQLVAGRGGHLAPSGQHLAVTGAEVSSLRRVHGRLELRLHNPSDATTVVRVPGRSGVLVDLRGARLGTFSTSLTLPPWGIATLLLDD